MKNFTASLLALFIAAVSFAQPCGNLFFSEYIEGSSNNKALELYNPTGATINLNNYYVFRYQNGGSTPADTLHLQGTLAAGSVFVIANASANSSILNASDTTHTVTFFNGDDGISLYDINLGILIDAIGERNGIDPGTNWQVGTGATSENTLVRKPAVQQGITDWATGQTQWLVLPVDVADSLGAHNMTPCAPITDTLVVFSATGTSVSEDPGPTTYNINLNLNLPTNPNTFSVDVVLTGGDATQVDNFTSQTVTFNNISTGQVAVTITNDAVMEDADTLVFKLRNPTGNLLVGADSTFTLIILPSDQPLSLLPLYPIGVVRGNNANGEPDSIGVECRVAGTVYGVNLNPAGLSFTINDGTGGIGVFSPSSAGNHGYTVNEGDSIIVQGEIDAFSGLGQIAFLDSIWLVGNGNMRTPTVVTALNEFTESEYIRINDVAVTGQFNGSGGITYDISNGTTTFEMYVDNDVNVTIPSSGTFDVIGTGGQFDGSSPYTSGYNITVHKASGIIQGIKELTAEDVQVYPNPATDKIFVNTVVKGLETIRIMDITGRLVVEQNLENSKETISINGLEPGMYIIHVTGENKVFSTRIVKM